VRCLDELGPVIARTIPPALAALAVRMGQQLVLAFVRYKYVAITDTSNRVPAPIAGNVLPLFCEWLAGPVSLMRGGVPLLARRRACDTMLSPLFLMVDNPP
jgi:hypothetical protein